MHRNSNQLHGSMMQFARIAQDSTLRLYSAYRLGKVAALVTAAVWLSAAIARLWWLLLASVVGFVIAVVYCRELYLKTRRSFMEDALVAGFNVAVAYEAWEEFMDGSF